MKDTEKGTVNSLKSQVEIPDIPISTSSKYRWVFHCYNKQEKQTWVNSAMIKQLQSCLQNKH